VDASERKSSIGTDGKDCILTASQGLVTSATKLNRKAILEKYKKEVEHAYKMSG
jgi:long-subunit acyl-CoA synthetase (AMP-forming)